MFEWETFGIRAAWIALLCLSVAKAEEEARTFWLFDMGPKGAPIERDHIAIDEKTIFTEELGYGWVAPPEETFNHPDAPSIDPLRQDGVISTKGCFLQNSAEARPISCSGADRRPGH